MPEQPTPEPRAQSWACSVRAELRAGAEVSALDGRAKREAGFPGDSFAFEVSPDPGCSEPDIEWSGGGEPATGNGRRFLTAFGTGGSYTITARCGEASRQFQVTVCPIDQWISGAKAYYGPSIDFGKVRVRQSSAVFGPAGTGWTCNTVIRFKRAHRPQDLPDEPTLIHEFGHVWEHQTGQAQLLKGMVEQTGKLLGHDPYDFGGPAGVKRARRLTDFSKESQAQILMEYWMSQRGYDSDSNGVPFSTPGYVQDLRRLVQGAGIGSESRRRRTFAALIDSGVAHIVNAVLRLAG